MTNLLIKDRYNKLVWDTNGQIWHNDYYLTHFPLKPKSEIAQYVASHGLAIPQIFETLDDAKQSWKDFIIRSEHPSEYFGSSWIFHSQKVDAQSKQLGASNLQHRWGDIDRDNLVCNELAAKDSLQCALTTQLDRFSQDQYEQCIRTLESHHADYYAQLANLNRQMFIDHLSFSYRELLWWYNRGIVADNGVSGRYHLFTVLKDPKHYLYNRTIAEETGNILYSGPGALTPRLKSQIKNDIQYYETIKNLDRFDPKHCPIIEFQTINNTNYFLQYHRTQNKQDDATFVLSKKLNNNQIQALFCRWVTDKEWIQTDMNVHFLDYIDNRIPILPTYEKCAIDLHYNFWYTEIMSRKRSIQIHDAQSNFDFFAIKVLAEHTQKSILFNPQVSAVLMSTDMKPYADNRYRKYKSNGGSLAVPIHILSDWKKAYVELLG